jgi:predicted metalloprotease
MKWEGERQSDNVEDRRSSGGGGLGGGMRMGGSKGVGLGTIVIAMIAAWIFGINPMTVLGILGGGSGAAPTAQSAPAQRPPANDKAAAFTSTVLAQTEDVWGSIFKESGQQYPAPKLVLFRGATRTQGCGVGESAMGPFYCPADRKIYIDLAFNETLSRQLGAPGDFAQAYVVAHEVGHHIQNVLGISNKVDQMRKRVSQKEGNALSVRVELQADCFAGVWAHHRQKQTKFLEPGDVEEAMNAAAKIGDDALQKSAQGHSVPDSFTHGTSAQRQRWFNTGLQSGSVKACDTFSTNSL